MIKKAGIYKIQSLLEPEKFYIGSSVNLQSRKRQHFSSLKLNKYRNTYMQNYYNKYGRDNFLFLVIEECDKENLITREQFYLDNLKPVFNSKSLADSNYGIVFSDDVRKNMSNAQRLWRQGKDLSTALTSANVAQIIEMKEEGFTNEYIAESLGISKTSVSNALTGKTKNAVKYSNRIRKLDEVKVKEIKKLITLNYTLKSIAVKYGVKPTVIANIKSGKLWSTIPYDDKIEVCTSDLEISTRLSSSSIKEIKLLINGLKGVRGELKSLAKSLDIPYTKIVDIKRSKNINYGL